MTPMRLSLRALVTAALVASPALFTASATSTNPCHTLARWAEQYRGTSPTLDQVTQLDRAHRRALLGAVSPAIRADLWREHLRRFAQEPNLLPEQRALIATAITLTTPELYEQNSSTSQAFDRLWPDIERTFAGALRARWMDLAASPSHERPTRPWLTTNASAQAAQAVNCGCNWILNDCWGAGNCVAGGCAPMIRGCGPMARDGCNGTCF